MTYFVLYNFAYVLNMAALWKFTHIILDYAWDNLAIWNIRDPFIICNSRIKFVILSDRFPVGKCKIWRRLQEVFIEDFLKTSSHLWEQLKPLTRGTSSGLHSSRIQDRCRRLQGVFSEHLLKTSSYLWEQLQPVTTGTSSGLPSSRLQDRCRRLQDVFIEDFLKTSSHLWEQLKPVTTGTSSGLHIQVVSKTGADVFKTSSLKTSWRRLHTSENN